MSNKLLRCNLFIYKSIDLFLIRRKLELPPSVRTIYYHATGSRSVANIPEAAGKRTSLLTNKTYNPFGNHKLKPLIDAMEKKREKAINVIAKDL